ncbi:hypothetical protein SAMN05216226_10512 [Halovenus aranensis]|uniref:DUF8154 domain-containing protein n=1 Tax=Halovenus aranensis TaxID=890420 RepID=A0A1G8UMV3_9EURY|nr:hypothetical protein [Halovenus aranensis]SDJ55049.1 hypothetical protein SAMN05216226_10512 [Halovenus aranensis]
MSDPTELRKAIEAAEDAFSHAHGQPVFEPGLNAAADASDGEVQIQKACRLLELAHRIDDLGEYYGAIFEHSLIAIEHTFQGYLLAMTGVDEVELRNHSSPYAFAKGQVPLDDETVDDLKNLYDARRTEHYYGTTVTTKTQAEQIRTVAAIVHEYIVTFDQQTEQFCQCD